MAIRRYVVIFARELRLGRGKRRLASRIGAVAALHFQRVALRALLYRLGKNPRWTVWIAMTPDRGRLTVVRSPGLAIRPQGGGDLGKRMRRPMRRPPLGLPPGPVVVIGSDIPDIRVRHIRQAFRTLERHAFVVGPARDGGYWLVGSRRRPAETPDIFKGVRWSTEHALADTLKNLRAPQVGPALPVLEDVDDAEAWRRWRRRPSFGFTVN
jgi:rSAM/selenodomain-associated transferase 1